MNTLMDWKRFDLNDIEPLLEVLNTTNIGNDLEISYHFGTQEESWESSSYDDDTWVIEEREGMERLFFVVDGYLGGVCKQLMEKRQNSNY